MTMRRTAAMLLAVAITTAACGHPLIPPSALRPAKTTAPATSFPAPSPTGPAAPTVGPQAPVLGVNPGKPILGVDLYSLSNYPAAVVAADGQRMLSYIKNVLNADAVGIVWSFSAPSYHSDAVKATADTLTPQNVAILTRIARQYHLRVEYRPLIFVAGHGNPWEGLVLPHDPAKWFASYYQAELPYLKVAQRLRVREFVAATEMHYLNTSPLWPAFFARIGKVYHGVVSYAAWDQDYLKPLLGVQYPGMDMYHRLTLPPSATAAQVTAAWETWLRQVPASVLSKTAIDETGIEARAGAYKRPQQLWRNGRPAEQVQANWYAAACRTVRDLHMRAVFFWKVDLTDNPAHPATSLSTFEGRKGAAAISECTRILH